MGKFFDFVKNGFLNAYFWSEWHRSKSVGVIGALSDAFNLFSYFFFVLF